MINLTPGILILKDAHEALIDFKFAILRVDAIVAEKPWKDLDFLLKFRSIDPAEYDLSKIIDALLSLCLCGSKNSEEDAEMYFLTILNFPAIGKDAKKHVQVWIKILFLQLYKSETILLPYKFSRPLVKWLDILPPALSCYTEVVAAMRAMDKFPCTGKHSGREHNTAEAKNRRVFGMATKIAFASTWYKPELISLEDFSAWRAAEIRSSTQRDGLISPLPLVEIASEFEQSFGGRLNITARQVRESIFGIGKRKLATAIIAKQKTNFLRDFFSEVDDPLELSIRIFVETGLPATAFCHETINDLNLTACLPLKEIDLNFAIKCWVGLEKEYLDLMNYESSRPWETLFGRMNFYLFVYLPVWFRVNVDSQIIYPDSPNKFTSREFYKRKVKAIGSSPLTLTEFYDALGFKFTYATANNLKIFFEYLVDFKFEDLACQGLLQPITWFPKSKKSPISTKNVFTESESKLYSQFLDAISSAEPAMDQYVKALQFRYSISEIGQIDYADIGYIPYVTIEGRNCPIITFDRRSLITMRVDNFLYYNPATTIMPYCLVRGGVRGQNLQWLDYKNYATNVDREIDKPLGVSMLFINTDKIRVMPFNVFCRYEVICELDRQLEWRRTIATEISCPGFDAPYPYEGNVDSKWGLISCLFANDPDVGAPVSDSAYNNAVIYSQLSFQKWMRENNLGATQFVAFIGIPSESKRGGTIFYSWDQWIDKKKSNMLNVKVVFEDLGNGEQAPYCPVTLRAKITSHGGRATHITNLLKHLPPEDVAKTTGQSAKTAVYYDKGSNDFRRRFAGVVNNQDPAKELLLKGTQHSQLFEEIIVCIESGDIGSIVPRLGVFNLSDRSKIPFGQLSGLEIIAREKAAQLGECSTHMCAVNFNCPNWVLEMFAGVRMCPWCPLSIFHTNSIFAVAAKRHQLAEDLDRIQQAFNDTCVTANNGERKMLEARLKRLADEVLAWLYVEKTMDGLIFNQAYSGKHSLFVVNKKSEVAQYISKHVVQKGSSEQFLRRLDEVCEFPNTLSEAFREKMGRAIRMILAQRGNIYEAILQPLKPNPELHLVSLIKESVNDSGFDIDKFIKLVNLSSTEWIERLAEERRVGKDDAKDDFGLF